MVDIISPRRGEFLTKEGIPTIRFAEYLELLTGRINTSSSDADLLTLNNSAATGASQKEIKELQSLPDSTGVISLLASLTKKIKDLELLIGLSNDGRLSSFVTEFKIRGTSSNLTTTGNEIIVCTNTSAITITLNPDPNNTENVHIVRQNTGSVDVSGPINGDTLKSIAKRYDSPHLVFTNAANEWSVI